MGLENVTNAPPIVTLNLKSSFASLKTSLQPYQKWPQRSATRLIIIIHLSRFNIDKSEPAEQCEVKYLGFVFNQQRPRHCLTKSIEQQYL